MALKIVDALKSGFPHDGSFGRAHLIFDRDIDANPLRVSLKKLLDQDYQEYLGVSFPGAAHWTRTRSHFFDATLVARGGGQTVYLLGPEVSTFVLDETMLEVASEDDRIRETAVWREISLDFGWQPPRAMPLWKPSLPPHAAVEQAIRQVVSSPAPADQAAQPQPEVAQVVSTPVDQAARQQEPSDRPPQPEKPTTTTTTSAISDPPAFVPPTPRAPINWRMGAAVLAAVAVLAGAVHALYWGTQNRDYLCDHFHMFCDPEVAAYRDAESCAAAKTCGASECVTHYRDIYPNGRFRAQIDDIAVKKGRPCPVYTPPKPEPEKPDPEKEAYDRADGCARPRSCGALECLADYRRRYPNGRYKAQIDQIAQLPKAAPCPDLDREAYERAERCAGPLSCEVGRCLAEYRRDFPAGKYRALIEDISKDKGAACPAPPQPSPSPTDSLPAFVPRPADVYAGINCNASNLEPIAQMICKDLDMARVNGELQKLFDAKLKSVGDASALRNDERAWIKNRDRECGIPAGGSWEINDLRRLKNCFLDKTRARANDLR